MNRSTNEILLSDSAWWIVARGQTWGPFDYQWSSDLHGIELTFEGKKFGEVCSEDEFFADLSPFRIPVSVCRVAAIVSGSLAVSIAAAEDMDRRASRLAESLERFNYCRFTVRCNGESPQNSRPSSQEPR